MAEQGTRARLWSLSGAPGMVFALRFTTAVVAAAPGAASRTEDEFKPMLQSLLQCSLAAVM